MRQASAGLTGASEAKPAKFPSRRKKKKDKRDELVATYLPLVRLVAERVHRRLPPGIDIESLVHSGVVGLLEALERYDPQRGVEFQSYARYRIQGEIMEYLRSLDWVSRSVRAWGRKVATARSHLSGRLGREASPQELADALGIPLDEYYRIEQKVTEGTLLSLEDLSIISEEEWRKAREQFFNDPFQDPLTLLESKDLVAKMTGAIERLPERERLVVTLYYHEELTLKEIGEVLSLSEGRISQIHAQAVLRLRQALEG